MVTRLKLIASGVVWFFSLLVAINRFHAWHWVVCLALTFSWLGDALLARYQPLAKRVRDPFLAGMGSFALAQIAYIVAFALSIRGMPLLHTRVPGTAIGHEAIYGILPVYLLLGALFWVWTVYRSQQPRELKAATLVYCILVSTMAGYACAAAFTGTFVAWPLIPGGILFMISDGCIAARIFGGRFADDRLYEGIVWGTYLPAQILLLIGTSWLF